MTHSNNNRKHERVKKFIRSFFIPERRNNMNIETPKKTKFDILEEIMISFQDDYETDYAQTHWVKTYKERKERLIQLQEEEYELQANVIDDAQDLGFVEGVRYALNIMDMTDAGKNKELLERLLNILEN